MNLVEAIDEFVRRAKERLYDSRRRAANRDEINARKRRWYAANPEQTRERNRRWRAANIQQVREQDRRRKESEQSRELRRRWLATNRDDINAYVRRRYAANPEQARERNRRWRAANRDEINARKRRRYAANNENIIVSETLRRRSAGIAPERLKSKGRFCICQECGVDIGWRCPSAIRANGTFCHTHRYSWRKHR